MLEKIRNFDDNVSAIEVTDGFTEPYFDVSQMDEAVALVTNNKKIP